MNIFREITGHKLQGLILFFNTAQFELYFLLKLKAKHNIGIEKSKVEQEG